MRAVLVPSILSCNLANAYKVVSELIESGAEIIQFDVMDGQFVPPITFGADLIKNLPKSGHVVYEAHFMTLTPERHFEAFAQAGCQQIIFHAEATFHAYRLASKLRDMNISPGVAINPGTPVETLLPLLEVIDLALIMTVNPGWGGQTFIPECLEKVVRLRQASNKIGKDLKIQVDGGIDPSTISECFNAGADYFVVGSFLNRAPSFGEALRQLNNVLRSSNK